jgi:pimeloyl-ACP methyl ester carboxylesterase
MTAARALLLHGLLGSLDNWTCIDERLPTTFMSSPSIAVRSFEKPALFLRAGKTGLHSDEDVVIQRFFPNAQMKKISDAGHGMHAEAPEIFLQIVRNFLTRLF